MENQPFLDDSPRETINFCIFLDRFSKKFPSFPALPRGKNCLVVSALEGAPGRYGAPCETRERERQETNTPKLMGNHVFVFFKWYNELFLKVYIIIYTYTVYNIYIICSIYVYQIKILEWNWENSWFHLKNCEFTRGTAGMRGNSGDGSGFFFCHIFPHSPLMIDIIWYNDTMIQWCMPDVCHIRYTSFMIGFFQIISLYI